MIISLRSFSLILFVSLRVSKGFLLSSIGIRDHATTFPHQVHGSVDTNVPSNPVNEPTQEQKEGFARVFNEVLHCTIRESLPSIVSTNIDLLIDLHSGAGVKLFQEQMDRIQGTGDKELIERGQAAKEYIVYFVETFVSQAKVIDDNNKHLLGRILKRIHDDRETSTLSQQEALDHLMKEEKGNFTPGFLRYIDGECNRVANAENVTAETTKLSEVLRIIQTRIIEELGQDLGEGAQVLGQLLGYESSDERLAVLDSGLKVRGTEFAGELKTMTEEALEGFSNVPGGVEPRLLKIVEEIDARINEFITN